MHWPTRVSSSRTSTPISATRRPGSAPISMAEYLNLHPRYIDSTETGGSSYLVHVGHAAAAIAAGRCQVALITMAGLARSRGEAPTARSSGSPEAGFESTWGMSAVTGVRARRTKAHVRVRHHQRPARRGEGGRLSARAAQPPRPPAHAGDRGRGARVPPDQLTAAPPRLLCRHRRRWGGRGGEPRGGAGPGAPDRARSWVTPKR